MTTRERNIALPMEQILAFCRRHPIRKLSLFGSVLREDFGEGSDVDLLVAFLPHARVTYFTMADMEVELASILGRKVDLRTAEEIHQRFRQQVLESAELLYAHE
ncbi:MAG TPA: nucleotidyltransferase family protein [Phycisphaerae bacterium]|nr:nucleotidyltransferase family protein [Phycisphaerae bacterium]